LPAKAGGAGTRYFVLRGEEEEFKFIMEGILLTLRAMRRGETGFMSELSCLQLEFQSRTFLQDVDILPNALTAAFLGESWEVMLFPGAVSTGHLLKSLLELDGLNTMIFCLFDS
jgi:hypothetical protein